MGYQKQYGFNLLSRKKTQQYKFFSDILAAKKKLLLVSGGIVAFILLIGRIRFYIAILKDLPDISKIESIVFSQATQITDRNGKVLYKMYQENRKYVPLEQISPNMINAIISVEDQDFWTNKGIDYWGLMRAGWMLVFNRGGGLQGGSTITQQLIKNVLLTRDKTFTRKLKELVLATQIDDVIRKQVMQKYPNLSSKDRERKVKEKILEMYLNYIFLGNNSYGVETASNLYFGTSAQYLSVLQSAILAGMPQAPSRFDPFKNKADLMGDLEVTQNGQKVTLEGTGFLKQAILNKLYENIKNINLDIRRDNEGFIRFLKGVSTFDIEFEGKVYSVKYLPGRKDISLTRLFEEGYIDQTQLKQAFLDGLDFPFQRNLTDMVAPHFVFWIIDLLKNKYDEQTLLKGGLTIKTTLDYDMQTTAEKIFKDNKDGLKYYGASNAAMTYVDSKNGDVLIYLGSVDYNDESIDGKVDVVQSPRQPGSSIKPLIYALGFMTMPLTLDTPIFDIPMRIGGDSPNNNDGLFEGMLPLKKALAHSRNIPAIKMYFNDGQDVEIVKFLKKLGLNTLSEHADYGYPLAIGAGEVKMIDLANAYMHLSALGKPGKIDPILEVRLSDGSLLYQKKVEQQEQVIPSGVAYLLRKILSDLENLPPTWVGNFTVAGLKLAHKSGTTDVKLPDGRQLPRDGWLAFFNSTRVAMFWAGNTDGKAMNANGFGGWVNSKSRKALFKYLKEKGDLKSDQPQPVEVGTVTINKLTGKAATADTPEEFKVSTMGYLPNLPGASDFKMKYVEIDKSCWGKRSPLTPSEDVVEGYVIEPVTFMTNGMDLNDIKEWISKASKFAANSTGSTSSGEKIQYQFRNLFLEEPQEVCDGRESQGNNDIVIELLKPTAASQISKQFAVRYKIHAPQKIKYVKVLLNDYELGQKIYSNTDVSDIMNVEAFKDAQEGTNYLSIIAIDDQGYSNKTTVEVNLVASDTKPPYLVEDKISVQKQSDGTYKILLFFADDHSQVKDGSITKAGDEILTFKGNVALFKLSTLSEVTYQVNDSYGNSVEKKIDLSKYAQ